LQDHARILIKIPFKVDTPPHFSKDKFSTILMPQQKDLLMGHAWNDELKERLTTNFGAKKAPKLLETFENAFSTSYHEECNPETAFHDIKHMSRLGPDKPIDIDFYVAGKSGLTHFR
jgi:NAD-specific glutamate dehydrogenase